MLRDGEECAELVEHHIFAKKSYSLRLLWLPTQRIADFTGSLVVIGFLQIGVAAVGLFAIWVSYKATLVAQTSANAAIEQARHAGNAANATQSAADAAARAAEAAIQSGEVAKLALTSDRPYLLIENSVT